MVIEHKNEATLAEVLFYAKKKERNTILGINHFIR